MFLRGGDGADREAEALKIMEDGPFPVPSIIDQGATPEGEQWLLMSAIPGVPILIDDYDSPEAFRFYSLQGNVAGLVHNAVRPPEYGVGSRRTYHSLSEMADCESRLVHLDAEKANPGGIPLFSELRKLQQSWLASMDDNAPVLVHGDLGPGNILVEREGPKESIVGIVDWETSCASTAAAEFAWPALYEGWRCKNS